MPPCAMRPPLGDRNEATLRDFRTPQFPPVTVVGPRTPPEQPASQASGLPGRGEPHHGSDRGPAAKQGFLCSRSPWECVQWCFEALHTAPPHLGLGGRPGWGRGRGQSHSWAVTQGGEQRGPSSGIRQTEVLF